LTTPYLDDADLRDIPWTPHELSEGETIVGTILRLPTPGAFCGSRLFIGNYPDEVLGIPATAKKGHTVLERELEGYQPGDRISVTYDGWRTTADGERKYRLYSVYGLEPAPV
jgi:hypothetical protein